MPRLSEGLILHVRQHDIVCKYIIWTYSGTEEAELWQSRSAFTSLGMKADLKMWNYRSFAVKAEGKWGGGTSYIWQWRQSVSGEADLQIFGSQDWAKVQKRNCKSLEVQAEMKCGSGISHLLEVLAEQVWKAELQIFASQGRAEVWNQSVTYLAVNAERKCGSGTSHFWQSMQNESADLELQFFGSKDRAEAEL